jgi:recombination protein RecA
VAHIGGTLRGNTEGRKLVVETLFARRARQVPLSSRQRELVIGALLGDGYLMPTTAGCCFRVNHGLRQRDYVDWKFRILVDLVRTPPRESGNCYYFRTVSHPEFALLRQLFYVNGRKTVPVELLFEQFTEFSLAVWLMDDGTVDGRQLRLNTQSFSKDESGALASVLRAKLGIDASLNRDKDSYRLRIMASSMARFRSLVQGYVIPSMLYKLPL